ncbi:AAA family ATPase [Aliarcobacter cryaerophilus]|uniref:AAA family ATPase n=1 Tax=Aliarcobacter cryaerophilus TaxID=28198 RepID=UPI00082FC151|nr:AAA family ATPase [Aliarcobacter cryaerophilus]
MENNIEEVKTLETEVKEFANSQPYWAKYLCSEVLAGNEITDTIIHTSYSYLLEKLDLKEETDKPELSISYNPNASDDFKENLTFVSLTNVEGVNALTENQTIELTPNLTIIYGANGAGKSGYIRLLKNVFYSKDKEDILPNINIKSGHKPTTATFNFSSDGTNISLRYPGDIENGIFNQFAVFDGDIAKKHLSVRNDFHFRPAGLQLFNEFNSALEKLNTKLLSDIQTKSIANPYADDDIFQGESKIKTFLTQLSHNSKLEELRAHLPYTDEEKAKKTRLDKEYDDLKVALAQKDKSLKELKNIKTQLAARKKNLETLNLWFTQTQLGTVISAITNCKTKEDTAQKEGVEKFKTDKVQNVGSTEWKQFIQAAETFASTQGESEYPKVGDNCLLCHQPISDDIPKNLINSYWAYIKSVAEQEAKTANEKLIEIKEGYEKLNFNQFPETDILTIWLKEKYEAHLTKLEEELKKQTIMSQTIISNINAKKDLSQVEIQLDLSVLDTISIEVDQEIKAFEEDKQTKKSLELLKQKTYLAHKEKLEARYIDIEKLNKNMIWLNKAHQFNKQSFKTQSTKTEKRLSTEYFNINYINAFNEECEKLNGKFGIEIDAKSSDAQSNRQLFLKGKDPSVILSEGEQKVIALADFIAEATITPINKGIIFDDPVNSLDEERKSVIAEHLVSISNNKQVIIFTYDLVFVSSLINYAMDNSLLHECHWIENRNGKPGQVWLKNSPTHEKVYRNAEPVKKFYSDANKDECAPEQREFLVKSGFTALRTCYEVLVINDLFKNVVQRYNERVSVDSLSSVYFDETLINELLDSFAQCCRYMEGHTHSDKYAYKKPEPSNLNEEIQKYEAIRNKIRKFKKT